MEERIMNYAIAGSIGVVLLAALPAVQAQEVAYEIRGCGTAENTVIDRAGDVTVLQGMSRGVADSIPAGGPFDKTTYECRSLTTVSKQGAEFSNRCVFVDRDGHKALGTSVGTGKGWEWKFLAGTGKWEGITGGGPGVPETAYARYSPAVSGGCYRAKGSFLIKH
jgi:hypothetical protein